MGSGCTISSRRASEMMEDIYDPQTNTENSFKENSNKEISGTNGKNSLQVFTTGKKKARPKMRESKSPILLPPGFPPSFQNFRTLGQVVSTMMNIRVDSIFGSKETEGEEVTSQLCSLSWDVIYVILTYLSYHGISQFKNVSRRFYRFSHQAHVRKLIRQKLSLHLSSSERLRQFIFRDIYSSSTEDPYVEITSNEDLVTLKKMRYLILGKKRLLFIIHNEHNLLNSPIFQPANLTLKMNLLRLLDATYFSDKDYYDEIRYEKEIQLNCHRIRNLLRIPIKNSKVQGKWIQRLYYPHQYRMKVHLKKNDLIRFFDTKQKKEKVKTLELCDLVFDIKRMTVEMSRTNDVHV